MIVELFGPPGAGKTTFAHALAARLREKGTDVRLRLSARPGEETPRRAQLGQNGSIARFAATLRRAIRPAKELAAAAVRSPGYSFFQHSTRVLASESANGRIIQFARYGQYMARLASVWRDAAQADCVWIFDQGYIQVISNIIAARPHLGDAELLGLLHISPKSDLVIRIEATADEISARLARRREQIGRIGDLLEHSSGTISGRVAAVERLASLVRQSGRTLLSVKSTDEAALNEGVDVVNGRIHMMTLGAASDTTEPWPIAESLSD